jgi:DNA-directed RNA polymerase subunit omega
VLFLPFFTSKGTAVANLPIEEIEKMVGSRYALTVLAGKRARDLRDGAPQLVNSESSNPILIALEEIYAGKVVPVNLDLSGSLDERGLAIMPGVNVSVATPVAPMPIAKTEPLPVEAAVESIADAEPSRAAAAALTEADLEEDLVDPDEFEALDGNIIPTGDLTAEE